MKGNEKCWKITLNRTLDIRIITRGIPHLFHRFAYPQIQVILEYEARHPVGPIWIFWSIRTAHTGQHPPLYNHWATAQHNLSSWDSSNFTCEYKEGEKLPCYPDSSDTTFSKRYWVSSSDLHVLISVSNYFMEMKIICFLSNISNM